MTAVGGRMEAVTPRRSLFGPDYLRLGVLAAVSIAVHLWLIGHTAVTARDSIGFARYALAVQSPQSASIPPDPTRKELDIIRREQHPPGYPLAVWFVAKFVRRATNLPLPDSTLLATQLVSALAALLLVVPMYLLGRMLFGRNVGFAAALLFQVLPVPARVTSDGLAEATYLLAGCTALALGVRAVRRPGTGVFLSCGLVVGLTYLVRPEGLMVAGAVGLVVGWLGLLRRWPRDLALGRLAALGVGVALVAAPYMIFIGKITNKPTGSEILAPIQGPRGMLRTGEPGHGAVARVGGPVFGAWWTVSDGAGPLGLIWPAVAGAGKEIGKGLHYFGAAFAVAGLFALRRRIVADPGVALLVTLLGVNLAVLVGLGARGYVVNQTHTFYISERHTVLIVLIGCLFAAGALPELRRALPGSLGAGRCVPVALLALMVVASLPSALKPLHPNREGHKQAGRWLKEHIRDADCLIDPFEWAAYYSGRTLYFIPSDPPGEPEITYAVVDDKDREDDHARLPRMRPALDVAADGNSRIVYHWPEDRPVEEARVKVYRLVRPKQK